MPSTFECAVLRVPRSGAPSRATNRCPVSPVTRRSQLARTTQRSSHSRLDCRYSYTSASRSHTEITRRCVSLLFPHPRVRRAPAASRANTARCPRDCSSNPRVRPLSAARINTLCTMNPRPRAWAFPPQSPSASTIPCAEDNVVLSSTAHQSPGVCAANAAVA